MCFPVTAQRNCLVRMKRKKKVAKHLREHSIASYTPQACLKIAASAWRRLCKPLLRLQPMSGALLRNATIAPLSMPSVRRKILVGSRTLTAASTASLYAVQETACIRATPIR